MIVVCHAIACDQVAELGRGQFGSVWLARWHGVEVALKELHGANSPRSREEMLGEACTLASLRHPCVIAIYGVIIGQVTYNHQLMAPFDLEAIAVNPPHLALSGNGEYMMVQSYKQGHATGKLATRPLLIAFALPDHNHNLVSSDSPTNNPLGCGMVWGVILAPWQPFGGPRDLQKLAGALAALVC